MAERTPTPQDIELPGLRGERPIAGYDLGPAARGAQALARGAEVLGTGITKSAEDIAAADVYVQHSQALLAEHEGIGRAIMLRPKYKEDTDYTTMAARHQADLDQITNDVTANLRSGKVRDAALARIQIPFAREQAAIEQRAIDGQKNQRAAWRFNEGNGIVDSTGPYDNDPLHTARTNSFAQQIDFDVQRGWMTPLEGAHAKRDLVLRTTNAEYQQRIRSGPEGARDALRDLKPYQGDYPSRLFHFESGGNPNAPATGSNRGMGQFSSDLERRYGIDDYNRRSESAQTRAVMMERAENAPVLSRALGREPTDAELYLAHQQGQAGAVAHLTNPDAPAWQNMLSTGEGRQKGARWAKAAIWGNIPDSAKGSPQFNKTMFPGGVDTVTSGDFTQGWKAKWEGAPGNFASGSYYHNPMVAMLPPDHRNGLITEAETQIRRGENENRSAFKLDQYKLKQAINDDYTSMVNTGRGTDAPPDGERIKEVLGEDVHQKWQDDRNDAHSFWDTTHDFGTLPENAIQERLAAITPQPGEAGFVRKQKVLEMAQDKAAAVLKERRDDPAGSVSKDPEVVKAHAAYDPKQPETFRAVGAARMAAQEHAGLAEEYRSPITKDEALQMTEPLRTMLPGQERDMLTKIGKHFEEVFGPEDAPRAFAYALRAHKVDAETAQIASRIMRKLSLGQNLTTKEAGEFDAAREAGAAGRAVVGDAARRTAVGDFSNIPQNVPFGEGGEPLGLPHEAEGPDVARVPPAAIKYLMSHPEMAPAFDKQFGQTGLAKRIFEKYGRALKPNAPGDLAAEGSQ